MGNIPGNRCLSPVVVSPQRKAAFFLPTTTLSAPGHLALSSQKLVIGGREDFAWVSGGRRRRRTTPRQARTTKGPRGLTEWTVTGRCRSPGAFLFRGLVVPRAFCLSYRPHTHLATSHASRAEGEARRSIPCIGTGSPRMNSTVADDDQAGVCANCGKCSDGDGGGAVKLKNCAAAT